MGLSLSVKGETILIVDHCRRLLLSLPPYWLGGVSVYPSLDCGTAEMGSSNI